MIYVSITGLELKSWRDGPRFWWHAIRSMRQAQAAPGNLGASTRTINGVHHTLSMWDSPASMRKYLHSSAHKKALDVFNEIATGKVHGYLAETAPDWSEVHEIWKTKGRKV